MIQYGKSIKCLLLEDNSLLLPKQEIKLIQSIISAALYFRCMIDNIHLIGYNSIEID